MLLGLLSPGALLVLVAEIQNLANAPVCGSGFRGGAAPRYLPSPLLDLFLSQAGLTLPPVSHRGFPSVTCATF